MCIYMSYMLVGGGERVEHANACGPPRSTYAPHVPKTHVCAFGIMCGGLVTDIAFVCIAIIKFKPS